MQNLLNLSHHITFNLFRVFFWEYSPCQTSAMLKAADKGPVYSHFHCRRLKGSNRVLIQSWCDMFYRRQVDGEQSACERRLDKNLHIMCAVPEWRNVSLHFSSSVVFGQFRMLEGFPWRPGRNRTRPFLRGKAVKGHFTTGCLLGRNETIENSTESCVPDSCINLKSAIKCFETVLLAT